MSIQAPVTNTPPTIEEETQEPAIPQRYIIIGVVVGFVLLVLLTALVLILAANFAPEIAALRDIFIIALALQSCIFGVILVIMLMMIVRLVNMLEFEIKPILEKTNETVGMVRGTTTFVSRNVVTPVTKATAYAAGVRRALVVLFGNPRKNLD
jgi:hypothetical protein